MKKIKWGNILFFIVFIASTLYVLSGAITIATSIASITLWGGITGVLALALMSLTGEYLYDEMQ